MVVRDQDAFHGTPHRVIDKRTDAVRYVGSVNDEG